MERTFMIIVTICCYICIIQAIESPPYRVVHSQSDFEIRLYRESSWISALVRETTSFQNATKLGFRRVYQYIHGANLNSSGLNMTAPVLTSMVPSLNGPEYYVKLYLPAANYEISPPQPITELMLEFDKWTSHCIAVREFSGYAKDDSVKEEFQTLVSSLNTYLNDKTAISEDSSYGIAQYNASWHTLGRLNEVWMDISGISVDC